MGLHTVDTSKLRILRPSAITMSVSNDTTKNIRLTKELGKRLIRIITREHPVSRLALKIAKIILQIPMIRIDTVSPHIKTIVSKEKLISTMKNIILTHKK